VFYLTHRVVNGILSDVAVGGLEQGVIYEKSESLGQFVEAEEERGVVGAASGWGDEEVAGFQGDNEHAQKSPLLSVSGGGVFETRVTRRKTSKGMV
jgi:hypothetical protein